MTPNRCFILLWLLVSAPLLAQPPQERAPFWAAKGEALMQTGRYADAYSAFQLARSLGAANMTARMELAKKRNINSIQFRALLAEARALAATNPTQSLRLLEYAHTKFPDSTSLLKAIGHVANQPGNWYYTLEAGIIKVSPKFTYLLSQTDKDQLYIRAGSTVRLAHTFTERFSVVTFSPDERYLFMGSARQGQVYRLDGSNITLVQTIREAIQEVRFSPNINPAYGVWLLAETPTGQTKLYDLRLATRPPVVFQPMEGQLDPHSCAFSPRGRYLRTPTGVWQLTQGQIRPIPLAGGEEWSEIAASYSRFSGDDRDLLITKNEDVFSSSGAARLLHYTFSRQGDTLYYVDELLARFDMPRMLWRPFSSDNRYLTFNDSLFYRSDAGKTLVQPVLRPGQTQQATARPTESPEFGSDFQFAPGNRHVLREVRDSSLNAVFQVWRLDDAQRSLIYEFTDKASVADDVFSPDGKYLLARHISTDRLWRIEPDTILLVHTFQNTLRAPKTFDEDGFTKPMAYFSPDSRYLITYSATPVTADSLWQLPGDTAGGLIPLYGFSNRLNESATAFSPDSRLLFTESPGYLARVWNLTEQITLPPAPPIPPTQALFSPKGNYLITDHPGILWRVTDHRVEPLQQLNLTEPLTNYTFSDNEQYLTASRTENIDDKTLPHKTSLYRVLSDRLVPIRQYQTTGFRHAIDSDNLPYIRTYQSSLFSPYSTHWLTSQVAGSPDEAQLRPDTVWNLARGEVAFAFQTAHRVDRYTVEDPDPFTLSNFPRTTHFVNWYSRPSALFSPDGQSLMTKEGDSLRFYPLHTTPVKGQLVAGRRDFPMDVSEGGRYWLTGVMTDMPSTFDRGMPDMPDTVRLWRRTEVAQGPVLKQLAQINGLYTGMNAHWSGNLRQSLFSKSGNYLLLPTAELNSPTLYKLTGNNMQPVLNFKVPWIAAAFIPSDPQYGWDTGLLYTTHTEFTYLLEYGGSVGTRTKELGYGRLQLPPRFRQKIAYWVRKLDDNQQQVELLDMATGQTLVRIPFGSVLDYTVRPNGNAWVVSSTGTRLVRSPVSVLYWLKKAPVAPLNATLRSIYSFQ